MPREIHRLDILTIHRWPENSELRKDKMIVIQAEEKEQNSSGIFQSGLLLSDISIKETVSTRAHVYAESIQIRTC